MKRLSIAKSRLRGALPGVRHEELALALARDTVSAALRCAPVLVVTDDPVAGSALAALGARVSPDRPGAGMNAALSYGAELLAASGRRVAALTADLPALRSEDLAGALASAGSGRAFVADAQGTGTTLLMAGRGGPLAPSFGPESAVAHAAGRAVPLTAPWHTLRRDVDTADDLAAARGLGLGPHTGRLAAAPAGEVRRPGAPRRAPAQARYGAVMQGTVATYDAETRSGTLLLDDGTELAFPSTALDDSGVRMLRQGQRVRIDHDESGRVVHVTLPTF